MKALVLKEYHHLCYEDIPMPTYGANDLLVRIKACAICGSDVHGIDGSTGRRVPPIVMGHEAAGVVERVGENVTRFQVGDRVTFDSTIFCGKCASCQQGRVNLCEHRRVLGVSCDEYRQNGAFAEYITIPQHIAYPLPENLSFEHAAMVEPVAIALHAVRLARPMLNETALVYGVGVIGLITLQLLKLAGCRRLIAVDLDPFKLEMARKLGATDGLEGNRTDLREAIYTLTQGKGVDLLIELVGIGATISTALGVLRKGGRLVQVGNFAPRVEIPLHQLITKEIQFFGSCASAGEYPDSLDLIARKALDLEALISAVAPLSTGAEWFQRLYGGESGLLKVILTP